MKSEFAVKWRKDGHEEKGVNKTVHLFLLIGEKP